MSTFLTIEDATMLKAAAAVSPGDSLAWHPPGGGIPTVFDVGEQRELIWVAGEHRKQHKQWPHGLRLGEDR